MGVVPDLRITNNRFTHILSMALPALHLYMSKINTTFSLSTISSNCYTNASLTLSNHIATSQLEVLHIHHLSQAAFGTDSILLLYPNISVRLHSQLRSATSCIAWSKSISPSSQPAHISSYQHTYISLLYLPLPWLHKCSFGVSTVGLHIAIQLQESHCIKILLLHCWGLFTSVLVQIPKPVPRAEKSVSLPKRCSEMLTKILVQVSIIPDHVRQQGDGVHGQVRILHDMGNISSQLPWPREILKCNLPNYVEGIP